MALVGVAETFLRNIYVQGEANGDQKASGDATTLALAKADDDDDDDDEDDAVLEGDPHHRTSDASRSRSQQYSCRQSLLIRKNRAFSRRLRLRFTNSADGDTFVLMRRLSDVLGNECAARPLVVKSIRDGNDSCFVESTTLLDKSVAISLRGQTVAIFSILTQGALAQRRRRHTLSRGSECSECSALRPFFNGSLAMMDDSHADSSEDCSVSFVNSLAPSSFFIDKRRRRCNHLKDAHMEFLYRQEVEYCSLLLDDSEFKPSGRKTTLCFVSYMTSVIDFTDPGSLKKESNDQFRRKFPDLQLSYSKYLSIKKEMKCIANRFDLDPSILAQAMSYFDQCVLKKFIDKVNRKHLAGVSIILAAKLNDAKGTNLKKLIEIVCDQFRLLRVELLRYELPVAVGLEFALHLPPLCVAAHYQRIAWES